jgi:hypothetical protein
VTWYGTISYTTIQSHSYTARKECSMVTFATRDGVRLPQRWLSFPTAHRDHERERRAHAHLASDRDPSAVEFDELPAEGQTQSRPLSFLLPVRAA